MKARPAKLSLINDLCEPYSVERGETPVLIEEIQKWCEENLKAGWIVKDGGSVKRNSIKIGEEIFSLSMHIIAPEISFEDDSDAVLFKMRWK